MYGTGRLGYGRRTQLDTGRCPPKDWERLLIQDVALPLITNASGRRMPSGGLIVLYVQVGGLLKRIRFYVTPGLEVPYIFGCGFINLHVKTIHPKERRVELTEGGSVAISNGLDAWRRGHFGTAANTVHKGLHCASIRDTSTL
jgi:hypothetical protein